MLFLVGIEMVWYVFETLIKKVLRITHSQIDIGPLQ